MSPLCQERVAVTQCSEEPQEGALRWFRLSVAGGYTRTRAALYEEATLTLVPLVLQGTANVSGGLFQQGLNNAVPVTRDIHNINLGLGNIGGGVLPRV